MARKTTGNGTTNRSKKTGASIQPALCRVRPKSARMRSRPTWFLLISKKRFAAAPTNSTCSAEGLRATRTKIC